VPDQACQFAFVVTKCRVDRGQAHDKSPSILPILARPQAAGGLAAVKLDGSATVVEQAAVAQLKSSLLPFTDGYYTNEVADEHQPRIKENYRGNIDRLRQLKRQYDPHNMFRLNANILSA
jgi:hypothetical protein